MYIQRAGSCREFLARDGTTLSELLHGPNENLPARYSLARARLAPGKVSHLHRLATSELYYVLSGRGRMEIDHEQSDVSAGDTVYIPPGASQRIANLGSEELVFLCIVDPAWRAESEVILESS